MAGGDLFSFRGMFVRPGWHDAETGLTSNEATCALMTPPASDAFLCAYRSPGYQRRGRAEGGHLARRRRPGLGLAPAAGKGGRAPFRHGLLSEDLGPAGQGALPCNALEVVAAAGVFEHKLPERHENQALRRQIIPVTTTSSLPPLVPSPLPPPRSLRCSQVDVFNPATQKSYHFPCNDWLKKTKEQGVLGCRRELLAGE